MPYNAPIPYTAPQIGAFNPLFDMSQLQSQLAAIPVDMSGINAYRSQALRTGPSTWANLQKTSTAAQTANQKEAAAQAGNAATAEAESRLASQGGLSSGAKERAAEGGANQTLNTQQDLTRQQNLNDLQTGINDETNRIQQLGALPGLENQATQPLYQKASILSNANAQENQALNQYNMSAAQIQQAAIGANQTANATIAESNNQGPCCFIFLEARYGNGTMDTVVRRFRDERMTEKNRRGYYKLSEVLVPMMRKSRFVKFIVRTTMTSPMVAYGKFYYGKGRAGFLAKPIVNFWLNLFEYLGGDHPFIRENGEVV